MKLKMKSKEFDQNIKLLDQEMETIIEKMEGMDPTTEEYERAAKSLKTLQEAKQIEVRNKSEHRNGLVPQWACWAGGAALSVLFGWKATRMHKNDGLYPTQEINFWDKFRPKF